MVIQYDKNIHRLTRVEVFPTERIVRRAHSERLRPRMTLLFWLAIAILPWVVIVAVVARRG